MEPPAESAPDRTGASARGSAQVPNIEKRIQPRPPLLWRVGSCSWALLLSLFCVRSGDDTRFRKNRRIKLGIHHYPVNEHLLRGNHRIAEFFRRSAGQKNSRFLQERNLEAIDRAVLAIVDFARVVH